MTKKILLLLAIFLPIKFAFAATENWHEVKDNGTKSRLIASFYQDENGEKKLIAGLHFKIADGWKIYAKETGGLGLPAELDFAGSKNYESHEIFWPLAKVGEEKIGKEIINYSYYQNEVILPIAIKTQKDGEDVELTATLTYGLCKEICIPANETISLKIPQEIDEEVLTKIKKFHPQLQFQPKTEAPQTDYRLPTTDYRLLYFFFALLGGAILNIMPCVLPVLSIKLLSIINHLNAEISRIRFAFLATILGIFSCFLVLATLAIILQLTGNEAGWGLQFQNPNFLSFLILLLILFIGNVLGVFEISFAGFLATILNKKISASEEKKNIFMPNFLSGILAVLLATPCSAPFLGTAISFALTQSFVEIALIFFGIALGFSLPYLILFASPKLVYLLPKPGAWMLRAKQMIAGLLIAATMWLIYILAQNVGALYAYSLAIFALLLLGCFKIKSALAKCVAFALVISAIFAAPASLQKAQEVHRSYMEGSWHKFDERKLNLLVAEGKTVLVDVTADWCLTCQFNKIRVLHDKEVMTKLDEAGVIRMRGDITKPDEEIMKFLKKHGRFAIPFNAVFGPSAPHGLLASELLSKEELLKLIEKAN